MHNPLYLTTSIAAITGLWFLWDIGIRGLVLDGLRERLFQLRFLLFQMGMDGELEFDSDIYRTMETLFNGLLRYAHRFSIATYVLSARYQSKARKDKDYVDVAKQIDLKISRVAPETQEKLRQLLIDVHHALLLYIVFSSPAMLVVFSGYGILKLLRIKAPADNKKVTAVIEREAYWAELRQHRLSLAAA